MSFFPSRFRILAAIFFASASFESIAAAQTNLPNGANESGFIANHSQTDAWSFTANKGDYIALGISEVGTNTGFWPYIRVYGPDGSLYGQSWGDLFAQVQTSASSTGTYEVLVSRYDSTTSGGSYLLTLAKAPGAFVVPSGDEGGVMTNGQNYAGGILRGDIDQWNFTANQGDDIAVGISEEGANTGFWPYIRVLGPDGALYGQSWGDLFAQVHTRAALTGTYTVVVSRYDQTDGTGEYLLNLAKAPGTFVVPTGDDGGQMIDGQSYSGSLLRGDYDQWSFTANKGDYIAVGASEQGSNTGFWPYIRLIGPDGSLYGQSWADLFAEVQTTAAVSGTYTVVISRYDQTDGEGYYSITMGKSPGSIVVPAGDQGGPMTNGQNYSGTLLRGDLDEWSFSANKGDYISLGLAEQGTNTGFWPYIQLLGPDGGLYGQGWGDLFTRVQTTAALTGTYTVLVSRYDRVDGIGNYLLNLAKAPGTFVVPAGDEGGPIKNGIGYAGTILRSDQDQWSFSGNQGDAITVNVSEQGANTSFWPYIRLVGPNGSVYGQSWGDVSAQVHTTLSVSGTYTVIVSRYDQTDGSGHYLLTLQGASGANAR